MAKIKFYHNAWGSAKTYQMIISQEKNALIIVSDQRAFDLVIADLKFFGVGNRLLAFPEFTQEPFEEARVLADILSERITTLDNIASKDNYIIIATPYSILKKIPSRDLFKKSIINIKKDLSFPQKDLEQYLDILGYIRVEFVSGIGEYNMRGDILDIFPTGYKSPIRLEYFDDLVEIIYSYNYDTQAKIESLDEIRLLPASELIISTEEFISQLATNDKFGERAENFGKFAGSHWLAPILGIKLETLFDYIDIDTEIFIFTNEIKEIFERYYQVIKDKLSDNGKLLKLDRNFITNYDAIEKISSQPYSIISDIRSDTDSISLSYKGVLSKFIYEKINIYNSLEEAIKVLREFINKKYKVVVTINSGKFYKLFIDFVRDYEIAVENINFISEAKGSIISIHRETITGGFIDDANKLLVVTDIDIFGFSKHRKKRDRKKDVFNTKLSDLEDGDYVVHVNHGIGIYRGLKHLTIAGVEGDFLDILYDGNDILYVPLHSIGMMQKYIGLGDSKPSISSLKSSAWQRLKQHAKTSAKAVAEDLLRLYAERKSKKGYSFQDDGLLLSEFESMFPYDETEDQLAAIIDTYKDMESEIPMERLICGDVGFGKTEVAMRASCKAVISSKQVAILVPTTILARQHYDTFKERFKNLPIKIDYISRFRSTLELKMIYKRLLEGDLDIVIGTHKLLSKEIVFKDLGLLVIDEEQRFGVNHKEKIAALKRDVDTLVLTATPIPRTLQLSLSGIRDISIMETPPENRLPVIVSIIRSDDEIKVALEKELKRAGQVFFLHNKISDIHQIYDKLIKIVPNAEIAIIHGQMNVAQLEKILQSFYAGNIDILISTTIIENGIDIPNVNSIIINNAGSFGLAQLYQLKGRVGRSSRRGYCYLFIDTFNSLSDLAKKRLTIIEQLSELGSGFKIAMYDLQLRGAGDILGADQSGFVVKIGYELYVKMIDEAVAELKGLIVDHADCEINSQIPYFIPASYIENPKIRFEYYRQLSLYSDRDNIQKTITELNEIYGEPPIEIINLSNIMLIKNIASKIGVIKINIGESSVKVIFTDTTKISYNDLLEVLTVSELKYRFQSEYELLISVKNEDILIKISDIFVNIYNKSMLE